MSFIVHILHVIVVCIYEFIIANNIKIHPLAALYPEKITDAAVRAAMDEITYQYGEYNYPEAQ